MADGILVERSRSATFSQICSQTVESFESHRNLGKIPSLWQYAESEERGASSGLPPDTCGEVSSVWEEHKLSGGAQSYRKYFPCS